MKKPKSEKTVTVIPGDGVGCEVMHAALQVLSASGAAISWEIHEAGQVAFQEEGSALPERVIESVRRNGVALKGPLSTSADTAYASPNVELREALGLHTTIRPCRSLEGVRAARAGVDVVIVKMNLEDLYARIGFDEGSVGAGSVRELLRADGWDVGADAGFSIKPLTVSAIRRVVRTAFEFAIAEGRSSVTAVHKAPLVPHTDGLFLEMAREIAESYPGVDLDDALVDTVCERLIARPDRFDVLVMPRMYGDIVSGVAAAMVGGSGVAPGVNLGEGCAVFEATHGSAPRLAGTGRVNPIALILSGAMMLRHLGQREAAERLEDAVAGVVREGRTLTYDLEPEGSPSSTSEVADAVVAKLGE